MKTMDVTEIKRITNEIHEVMPWLSGITDDKQYNELMELMDGLIENYDTNKILIDLLFPVLERYEEESSKFNAFNQKIADLNQGVAMLRVIIDQYGLTLSDFENEIGKKSAVSMILNGSRSLTLKHIRKLSARFEIPCEMFI